MKIKYYGMAVAYLVYRKENYIHFFG